MNRTALLTFLLTTTISGLCPADDASEAERLFTLKVQPLLSEKCYGCHGDDA